VTGLVHSQRIITCGWDESGFDGIIRARSYKIHSLGLENSKETDEIYKKSTDSLFRDCFCLDVVDQSAARSGRVWQTDHP